MRREGTRRSTADSLKRHALMPRCARFAALKRGYGVDGELCRASMREADP
jgi:hypothetical protein